MEMSGKRLQKPRRFSVSNVITSMDHWKEPLDLEIGDTIIWRGEGMGNTEGMILISPGMKGKVITRSENLPVISGAARAVTTPEFLR